jgi:hypothetical protein
MVSAAMEHLCAPTRRYQELIEHDRDDDGPFEYTEVALAISVEDFLIYYWNWKDLQAFLAGGVTPKILWITEHAFLVAEESENVDFLDGGLSCIVAKIHATSGEEETLILAQLSHADKSTVEVSVFWRAIMTSNSVKLTIEATEYLLHVLPSGPVLSQFLRESPSLQALDFRGVGFTEELCRVFVTLQRTDLKVTLSDCIIEPEDTEEDFIEWFRNNQVVTEIDCCHIGDHILSALSGNNSVKKLTIDRLQRNDSSRGEILCLAQALPGNMGIEHLTISGFEMSDEIWIRLFRSLSTHSRISLLSLRGKWTVDFTSLSAASKTKTLNAIVEMLQRNTVVRTIELPYCFNNEAVYQNSILPRLEMNRNCFEVQRQAVKRADPSIRPQLLGRALHVVRYNPNLVFQFLSENVPAFVRTEEEDEEEASVIPLQNDPAIVSGQKRKAPS